MSQTRIGGLLGVRRAANPTMRDYIARGLLSVGEETDPAWRDIVSGLVGSRGYGNTNFSALDMAPLAGPVVNAQEDWRDGNYKGIALNALSAVPALGGLRGLLTGATSSAAFPAAVQWASRAGIAANKYLSGNERQQ